MLCRKGALSQHGFHFGRFLRKNEPNPYPQLFNHCFDETTFKFFHFKVKKRIDIMPPLNHFFPKTRRHLWMIPKH